MTFAQFIFGYFYGIQFQWERGDWSIFIFSLVVTTFFLYGGIYAINDAHDYLFDQKNPYKKFRPVAAGAISQRWALIIGMLLIFIALLFSLFCFPDKKVFIMCVAYLGINGIYTYLAKDIPYVEIVVNSVPHMFRFMFGIWLAGGRIDLTALIVWFIGSLNISIFRRIKELDEKGYASRPVLSFYSKKKLYWWYWYTIPGIMLLMIRADYIVVISGAWWILYTLIVVLSYQYISRAKKVIQFVWR